MIRNGIVRCQSLGISYFLITFQDSRHVQLALYTVVHEKFESAVRLHQFLHPEENVFRKRPTRVSISYRKSSYHMSPPYYPQTNSKNTSQHPPKTSQTYPHILVSSKTPQAYPKNNKQFFSFLIFFPETVSLEPYVSLYKPFKGPYIGTFKATVDGKNIKQT